MSFSERWREVREGFQSSFWVANISELFERLAFYAQQSYLAIFLVGTLHFAPVAQGKLMSWFGLFVYALPVVVGSLADRFGFRRALAAAYLIAACGYFLLGSLTASWMAPVRHAVPLYWLVFAILAFTALGPALVKPCVVGTVATSSKENVRSLGYSIYYTLVNIGGAAGPLIAAWLVTRVRPEGVFRFSAVAVLLMFAIVLLMFREPDAGTRATASVGQAMRNTILVLRNWRFMLFLLIFAGYWVTFYAFYVVLPVYISNYVKGNPGPAIIGRVLAVDPIMIIAFQVMVSYLTRTVRPFRAVLAGVVIATLSMLTISARPTILFVVAGLAVFSIGEMTQAPRYYEYVSRLAPAGQQGVFMGYAFLPIALGYFIAGQIGGHLVEHYGEALHRPAAIWWVLAAIGAGTTIVMWVYDRAFKPGDTK